MFLRGLSSPQVPRYRRSFGSAVKPTDLSSASAAGDGSAHLETLENHLQVLRSMPVNLSMNSGSASHHGHNINHNMSAAGSTEQLGSKCASVGSSLGGWGGVGVGVGMASLALVKSESQMSNTELLKSCCGGSYRGEPGDLLDYQQSRCDLKYLAQLKEDERSSPDSTYDEDKEVPALPLHILFILYYTLCTYAPLDFKCG